MSNRRIGILATLVALIAAAPAAAAPGIEKGPEGDAFYQAPRKVPKEHGRMIWARKAQELIDAKADRATSYRVLYTSRSPQGDPIAVSGSVAVPKGKTPKGGWPVITWDHGTGGLADVCAGSKSSAGTKYEPFVDGWLQQGYAVLRTDYQGLGTPGPHPYLIGKSAARSTLDITAAARELVPNLSKRYVIAGASQGGHAALWTANYADSWQPDLRLQGTMSFAPASHIADQVSLLPALTSPNPLSALAAIIFAGASTANPAVVPEKVLNPEALALYPQIEQKCLSELSLTDSFGGLAPSDLIQDGADLAPLMKVLTKNNPAVTSSAPIIVLQGDADTTVFPQFTDQLVKELEAKNDDVTYAVIPGADHPGVMVDGLDEADAFLQQHLPAGR